MQLLTNEWSESKEVLVTEGRRGRTTEEREERRREGRKGCCPQCPGVGDKPE